MEMMALVEMVYWRWVDWGDGEIDGDCGVSGDGGNSANSDDSGDGISVDDLVGGEFRGDKKSEFSEPS